MTDPLVPKLLSVVREGYSLERLKVDAQAGLTVAIVALPLSIAIAVASGVTPDRGLFTAIVGGFLVSLLGGSRVQIGGPAGALIVLTLSTVNRHGIDGLMLATFMSGILLFLAGWLRLGTYIKLIPYPVTVGFTAGIGVIIFASQIRELLGMNVTGNEPSQLLEKLWFLKDFLSTVNPAALFLASMTMIVIIALRTWLPRWPSLLIAVSLAALFTQLLHLDVHTIGSRFGGIPARLNWPAMPVFSMEKAIAVLPDALALTLLGMITALLSAIVGDGLTGRRHRPSMELIAQGVANMACAVFGAIPVTGAVARTITNIRSGATSPVSGMLHALYLLLFVLLAAPLASYIPLSALAGVLAIVSWNMIDRTAFAALFKSSRGDTIVLLATFLLVIFKNLTEGIIVGFALGAFLFIDRMGKSVVVESDAETPSDATDPDTLIYRIHGAFFFGAASSIGAVLDRVTIGKKTFILDFSDVPFLDSTAATVVEGSMRKARKLGLSCMICGTRPGVRRMLETHGVYAPQVVFFKTVEEAIASTKPAMLNV
jgi:sulfate permease, SulP family